MLVTPPFYDDARARKAFSYNAVLDHYSQCNPAEGWDGVHIDAASDPETVAHQTIDAYLSSAHLDDVAGHCPLVALPAEVSRGGGALKARYRETPEAAVITLKAAGARSRARRSASVRC